MKILFIYPDMITPDPDWRGYFYEGLAMLSSAAKAAGHRTELLHVFQPVGDGQVLEWVNQHREGNNTLLAFSATTNQFHHVKRWAPLLKRGTGLPTIVGGMHPTLSAEDAIKADGIDMICCGDGEGPLAALATRLENGASPKGVEGIWYHDDNGEVVRQALAPNTNIDTAAMPDWGIFPHYEKLEVIRQNIGILMGSRGCPYNCAYCCNLALIKQSKGRGKYLRFKDVPVFIHEIQEYRRRYPKTEGFFFEDDIFGVWRKWLKEFVPAYIEHVNLPFGCNMRPNLVDQEMVDLLKQAGCRRVHMAIEAGSEEVRNRILNRNLSRETLVTTFKMFKDAGIQCQSYNIIGSPHETAAQILETIKINAEIAPDWIQHSIFYPYEGTPLYDLVHKEGLVSKTRVVTDYFADTVLEQDCIDREQVIMFQRHFKTLVKYYQRLERLPKPLRKVGTRLTDSLLTMRRAPGLVGAAATVRGWFKRNGHKQPATVHAAPPDSAVQGG